MGIFVQRQKPIEIELLAQGIEFIIETGLYELAKGMRGLA